MLFKTKISLNDLTNTYVGVINYIYSQFNLDLNSIDLCSFLLDLYCFLYFGTFSNLEKLLTQKQIKDLENSIIATMFNDDILNKINLEKIKDFNWNLFFQKDGTLYFLQNKLNQLKISFDEQTLYSYSFLMLNNLNATNSYLKTVKL